MANHPSALKRHRQSERARVANRTVRSKLRTLVRQLREAVAAGSRDEAETRLREATKELARAASKGVLPRRTASRQTSRLAVQVAKLSS